LTVCVGLAASVSFASLAHAQAAVAADPDALYAQREDPAKARQAANAWAQRLKANPKDFESAWKLAKALYWLGGHGPEAGRRADLEAGMAAADTAIALDPKRPEGYFWKAANMGALAESFGMRQGIKYRKPIREALETVLKIDPKFQAGSADRALGRWYYKVPSLFGGSDEKAVEHLRKSIEYDPNSTASHFFLAEALLDMGRKDDARAALQKVLDAPIDDEWAPEDREFKQKAKALLGKIGN
jgi:tetratricopeptide (TPR) repeat protein